MDYKIAVGLIALLIFQRFIEFLYSKQNKVWLLRNKGINYDQGSFKLIALVHVSWMISIFYFSLKDLEINYFFVILFFLLQIIRVWILVTLRNYWTVEIIRIPNTKLVKKGPYKYIKHPNYLLVVFEVIVFSLIFNEKIIAIIFCILHILVLWNRIKIENEVLKK